jgi:DNA sulfur modification protein DndC
MHYELIRELLSLTFSQKNKGRRAGLFKQLEKTFRRNFYEDKTDALERARHIAKERERYKTEREELALQGVSELEDAAMGITL